MNWIKWHPRGNVLLAGSSDGTCWMWNADDASVLGVFAGHEASITCGDFSPNGLRVLTGSLDGTCRLWDPKKSSCLHVWRDEHFFHSGSVLCLSFDPTKGVGKKQAMFASGGQDGNVCVCNLQGMGFGLAEFLLCLL